MLTEEKRKPRKIGAFVLWYLQESNQGHQDFQSCALPTELRYLPFPIWERKYKTRLEEEQTKWYILFI